MASSSRAIGLRAELARFERQNEFPDDFSAPERERTKSKRQLDLGIEQAPGDTAHEQVLNWAEGVRAAAARAVVERQEASRRAREVAESAAAKAEAEAAAAAKANEKPKVDWALQAMQSVEKEMHKDGKGTRKSWGGAGRKVAGTRNIVLGGLTAAVQSRDESHSGSALKTGGVKL